MGGAEFIKLTEDAAKGMRLEEFKHHGLLYKLQIEASTEANQDVGRGRNTKQVAILVTRELVKLARTHEGRTRIAEFYINLPVAFGNIGSALPGGGAQRARKDRARTIERDC
jgi:hypothetical protein